MALPSLSAIKCAMFDNKTPNTNDKNLNVSTLLTATHQKLLKSEKGNILLSIMLTFRRCDNG